MNNKQMFSLATIMFILILGATAIAQPYLDCSNASVIACGETQTNSTPPGKPGAGNVTIWCDNDIFTYEDAWEFVYEFTLEGEYSVTILMTYDHIPFVNDLDMSVRSICDESECLAVSFGVTGIEEINIDLSAGTYYIGLDGYLGRQDGSPHTMNLICEEPVGVDQLGGH